MSVTAILLCAGEGSRIRSVTSGPKCLLPVAGKAIVQHQLDSLYAAGVDSAVVVTGYQSDFLRLAITDINHNLPIKFVENGDYQTLGNSFSLLSGLQAATGAVVILDGDLMFSPDIIIRYLHTPRSSFLIGEGRADDWECAKALADDDGYVRRLVDKRLLTDEELLIYNFVGEALGIIYLDNKMRHELIQAALEFIKIDENKIKNWEHLFSNFLIDRSIEVRFTESRRWIEIDNAEDYEAALAMFQIVD